MAHTGRSHRRANQLGSVVTIGCSKAFRNYQIVFFSQSCASSFDIGRTVILISTSLGELEAVRNLEYDCLSASWPARLCP